jgi:AraC family transcriptional regulator
MCSATHEKESRTTLMSLPVGLIENVDRSRPSWTLGPEGFSPDFQVCLPYRGLFVWHVRGEEIVGDPNQVIFVRSGEPYRLRGPHIEGYAELIITPDIEVVSALAYTRGQRLADHPLFSRRSCPIAPLLQQFSVRFRHWAVQRDVRSGLEAEELVLAILRCCLQRDRKDRPGTGPTTARVIRRAKEYLGEHLSQRVLLADVARAAGVSPTYLTDVFTRIEGVSLHQYLTRLRLARSLVELPHTNDLAALALDIGFSSHSHFTFAFHRILGCTPSQFRQQTRRAITPSRQELLASTPDHS